MAVLLAAQTLKLRWHSGPRFGAALCLVIANIAVALFIVQALEDHQRHIQLEDLRKSKNQERLEKRRPRP